MHNTDLPNFLIALLVAGCSLAFIMLLVVLLVWYENRSIRLFKTPPRTKPTKYPTKSRRGWF